MDEVSRYLFKEMRRFFLLIIVIMAAIAANAQVRKVQNKPYIDLRPLHFGLSVGLNMQDIEFQNIGPRMVEIPEQGETEQLVLCDADTWNPGFSVGVLADMRLSQHFSFRVTPQMHFGSKHLVFRNFKELNDGDNPTEQTQDMKNTYISVPATLKFSAERFNNYRPYILAGVNGMINLSGKDQDFLQLKRYDALFEVGLGCDFYLPFFKLIPELKFGYSLLDVLNKNHVNELTDINKRIFSESVSGAHSKMFVLTLYFE